MLRNTLMLFVPVQRTATLHRYYEIITIMQIRTPSLEGRDLQEEMSMQYCMLAMAH